LSRAVFGRPARVDRPCRIAETSIGRDALRRVKREKTRRPVKWPTIVLTHWRAWGITPARRRTLSALSRLIVPGGVMDYADYVRQINFRLFQPETPRPAGFQSLNRLARKAGIHLEMWMTTLPEEQAAMQQRLDHICRLRHRSTFAIGAIINRGVDQLPAGQAFLGLGTGCGFSLLAAMADHPDRHCIGVGRLDKSPAVERTYRRRFEARKSPWHAFHSRSFRDYLIHAHERAIGYCSCAGLRTYADQFDALRLVEPFLSDNGFVLLNDANLPEIRQAISDFTEAASFEYATILDIQTPRSGHPTFWNGVALLQRGLRKAISLPVADRARRAA
jgi:hypothetical protein